ncbi:hypothetical protein SLEP1_g24398 [Rubroshorea leprosula]|uniref:Uncharacterized protein n=1 Tax=Rubroshorea leprosula TaxID=152421 RepID=A0AAV5JFL1_9ROSI|nr:hypothetical protein SLEP1_g24398 [Rubroshorea leprosula]
MPTLEFFGLFFTFEIDCELRIFLVNPAWFCLQYGHVLLCSLVGGL